MEISHKGPKENEAKENEKTQEDIMTLNNSKIINPEIIKKNLKLFDERSLI